MLDNTACSVEVFAFAQIPRANRLLSVPEPRLQARKSPYDSVREKLAQITKSVHATQENHAPANFHSPDLRASTMS
jgi:hypothetical protein